MALVHKAICSSISTSSSLVNFNFGLIQNQLRHKSSGSSDSGCDPPCILPPSGGGNPNDPTIYDVRKFGHSLPTNSVCPCFEVLQGIPSGIFRCTDGEVLGYGAGKYCHYLNPEYFSFHHMSFYDIHLHLRKYRLPCPDSQRKPP